MREIQVNYFYMRININQRTQYFHANQITKEWERWNPIPIFQFEATNFFTCFLINHFHLKKIQQTFTILFYIMWIFYLNIQLFLVDSISVLSDKLLLPTTRCTCRKIVINTRISCLLGKHWCFMQLDPSHLHPSKISFIF